MNHAASPSAPVLASGLVSEEQQTHWRLAWLATVDHKRIGVLYLLFALLFFVIGGLEALFIRLQLAVPNNTLVSANTFNALFTMHGTTMIFLVAMPALFGLANYFVPLMIGARDMAFPRLNALSVWLLPLGGALLHFSIFTGVPKVGWFAYAPLSETPYSSERGVEYWILALIVLGIGSVATAVNLIATTLSMRAPGMTMRRLPLFVWINFVNSFIVIFALPVLNAGLVMLLMDRQLGTHFFLAREGGSPVLWQHIFWAFGHPEVYILALPAFAIISEVVPVFSRKPIFGYEFVAMSSVAIALLSFGVWAHHMFTVGMGFAADAFFAIASMLIAIPTGVKVLNWTATMFQGRIQLTVPMLYAIAFVIQFTAGGLSGVTHASAALDWQTKNSYYLIAHFHYVAVGGVVFAILAGLHYWFPKMSGRMLSEKLGRWTFAFMVLGFNGTFAIQHFLGFMGMPRRVYTYPDFTHWGWMNFVSTTGACLMGVAAVLLVINLLRSYFRGAPAGANPWSAWTLEWATTSPPPVYNFTALPPLHSRRPLWDTANPDRPDPRVGTSGAILAPDRSKTSVWALIASEAAFFGTLLFVFLYFNLRPPAGANAKNSLELAPTLMFSACLFASSFTLWRAEVAEHRQHHGGMIGWLALTIALGATFIGGQAWEYYHLYHSGVTVGTNLFGASFYLVTGFHGFHVVAGLIALAIVLGLAMGGDFRTRRSPLVAIGLYWHFVDVVWVFVLAIVYFLPRFL
ncbi:cytochrome c oxidase subunit I [Opitutus terrae]|uniref:Cytochrome c oxidase subunit 1 n=1 Tax=Opitutus terrae (strain DSM 11246 / JCM 15787 / PB90-1) TaxID=452637 RepID=B1ZVF1_OPITP|nr:cytochrome c oxidase subunit I [Opitutus terrae]ACB76818.1 cytochrome c oxidase, subunit I [Opitutus terrae PB90-1]